MSGVLHLHALGCAVTMMFRHAACAEQASEMLHPLLVAPWRSPDLIIECDWERMRRDFIRSRVSGSPQLEGVRVFSAEHPSGIEWASPLPPFPPVNLIPLRDRFTRLHAAGVVNPQGGALAILGESGYGKSTISLQLVREYSYALLTDEDLFLHRRSLVAEPFAAGFDLLRRLQGQSNSLQALVGVVAQEPAVIRRIVVLNPDHPPTSEPTPLSPEGCFRSLLSARRLGGSSDGEDLATLALAARCVPAMQVRAGDYHMLRGTADVLANL